MEYQVKSEEGSYADKNRNNTFWLLQKKVQIHLHCKCGKQWSLIMKYKYRTNECTYQVKDKH